MTTAPARLWSILWRGMLAIFLLPVVYLVAALLLGWLPVNRDWHDADRGITVWLTTNGVHAGLTMPIRNESMDWTALFPVRPPDGPSGSSPEVVTVGWGDRTFFLNVPTWNDLDASTALYALSGLDRTVMHVEYEKSPVPGPDAVALTLTPEAYGRLVAFIRASTTMDANGRAVPIEGHGYGENDAFYEAQGHYSLFTTCNQWVRDALSAAGVRAPWWAPFDKPLFWQLRRDASGDNTLPGVPPHPHQ
ncbi:uncharacterized protein (TIGR02117 family) [Luteibacter rhizovicinus]|uniref:Uncharacterized protein (TIGR02117 family) n=1 Tax=Luteibacter rhizovicinus TaxID=242606 RepID=A0A4R3YM43_9GAMM|nr:TIGR02117 family protein [Luteibacter rhizovicinus]TCV93875.1 uncharacterized protein (TIGR02117 family) [Luteibacter rhizovicinus]